MSALNEWEVNISELKDKLDEFKTATKTCNDTQKELNNQLASGKITSEQYAKASTLVKKRLNEISKEAKVVEQRYKALSTAQTSMMTMLSSSGFEVITSGLKMVGDALRSYLNGLTEAAEKAEKKSNELDKKRKELEKQIKEANDKYNTKKEDEKAQNEENLTTQKELQAKHTVELVSKMGDLNLAIQKQQKEVEKLQKNWDNVKNASSNYLKQLSDGSYESVSMIWSKDVNKYELGNKLNAEKEKLNRQLEEKKELQTRIQNSWDAETKISNKINEEEKKTQKTKLDNVKKLYDEKKKKEEEYRKQQEKLETDILKAIDELNAELIENETEREKRKIDVKRKWAIKALQDEYATATESNKKLLKQQMDLINKTSDYAKKLIDGADFKKLVDNAGTILKEQLEKVIDVVYEDFKGTPIEPDWAEMVLSDEKQAEKLLNMWFNEKEREFFSYQQYLDTLIAPSNDRTLEYDDDWYDADAYDRATKTIEDTRNTLKVLTEEYKSIIRNYFTTEDAIIKNATKSKVELNEWWQTERDTIDKTVAAERIRLDNLRKTAIEYEELKQKELSLKNDLNDTTGLVTPEQRKEIEKQLDRLEQLKANPDVTKMTLEEYNNSLAMLKDARQKYLDDLENVYFVKETNLETNINNLRLANEKETNQQILENRREMWSQTLNIAQTSLGGVSDLFNALADTESENSKKHIKFQIAGAYASMAQALASGIANAAEAGWPAMLATIPATVAELIAEFVQVKKLQKEAKNFAVGGLVRGPGGPKDDKVKANLSNGEAVMNAKAVSLYAPLLDALNRGTGGAAIRTGENSNGFMAQLVTALSTMPQPVVAVTSIEKQTNIRDNVQALTHL